MASRPSLRAIAAPISRRLASTSQASSSTSSSTSSVQAPPTDPNRIYTERKTFLYNYYNHLFASSQLVLLFHHSNLTTADTQKLRRAINAIPLPPTPFDPSSSTPTSTDRGVSPSQPKATLTITRTGLLSAYSKTVSESLNLKSHLSGPTALLTTPNLSPQYLSKILSTITKTIKSLQKAETNPDPKSAGGAKQPKLDLVAGILEGGRLMLPPQIGEVGKLPELDVLRAQVVGMLEGQGRGLVGVLAQAGGGGLVRTLQGLEKGLKDGQEGVAES